jgi:RecA/RadA recombinase
MNEQEDQLKKLLNAVEKDFKKTFKDSETEFIRASEEPPPTGIILDNPLLELLLDRRFLPYGRCYLSYGDKSSGKTSLFYDLAKLFQKNNGVVLWFETERAADLDYAAGQGVNTERLGLSHPRTLEEALTAIESAIDNLPKLFPDGDTPVLVCLDSIAGTMTDYESEQKIIGENKPGEHAKLLAAFYRRIDEKLATEKCVFLAINQLKEVIGGFSGFGEKPEALIGGRAQRFHSTYQFKNTKTGEILTAHPIEGEKLKIKIGSHHEIVAKRNKLGREGNTRTIAVDNYIRGGYDWYRPLVDMLSTKYTSLVGRSGAYYTWKAINCSYIHPESKELTPIDTEMNYRRDDLATIICNSNDAKEIIRSKDVFDIRPLPSYEEVEKVENENKRKRKKKLDIPKEL